MSAQIIVERDDSSYVDVTEAVQIVYDALCNSMDAGSGFLDTDEKLALHTLAKAAGFKPPEFDDDECADCKHTRGNHWGQAGCNAKKVITPRQYGRFTTKRTEMKLPKDIEAHMEQRFKEAKSKDEIIALTQAAAVLHRPVEVEYEATRLVAEEVSERCSCEKFA